MVVPEAFEVLSRLATTKSSIRATEIIPGHVNQLTAKHALVSATRHLCGATVFPSHSALTLEFWVSAIRAPMDRRGTTTGTSTNSLGDSKIKHQHGTVSNFGLEGIKIYLPPGRAASSFVFNQAITNNGVMVLGR